MRIAVCGLQTASIRGGAELLLENLCRQLREQGHTVKEAYLPFSWGKKDFFDSVLSWRVLDLDADLVIATNFPSYYVSHPNKVVWLLHQHRALYELYGTYYSAFGLEPEDEGVRLAITRADSKVLGEAKKLFTISRNVSHRLWKYNHLKSIPLYHPPPLRDLLQYKRYGNFVLSVIRLEAHKRPNLVIETLRHTGDHVRFVLVGTGGLEKSIKEQISQNGLTHRIDVLGEISAGELAALYAECAAVLYAPYDEDYGYVTLEAFLAKKPVVTTRDAGGVLEFVKHEMTGLVAEPNPRELATFLERLMRNHDECRRLGEAGYRRVRQISWGDVVRQLVG
jgi:glycosyltransferase involved in cell wall biosynthesis